MLTMMTIILVMITRGEVEDYDDDVDDHEDDVGDAFAAGVWG